MNVWQEVRKNTRKSAKILAFPKLILYTEVIRVLAKFWSLPNLDIFRFSKLLNWFGIESWER